ncbi:hypothetical protein F2P81_019737 [Scophthalmus maximus]|uniref:PHD-type domain-containing protein n=1 Tax=Scophthalmus maximus TaxID=52904 RepID=A0A6A4SAF7_SCOMX|nr:hypothetical protein F2P81_019737 [Scophthalmus maximus]
MDSGSTPNSPGPSPVSPLQPKVGPSPVLDRTTRCEASPGPNQVLPTLATTVQSENSPSPGPASPVRPDAGPGNLERDPKTERKSAAAEDIEVAAEQKTEEEESDVEALQQPEEVEPHQTTEKEEPVGRTEEVGEQDQEEDPPPGVSSLLHDDHQSPHTAAASPSLSPQPPTPHSALPLQQPSDSLTSSPPALPLPSPQSPPPSPPRAGSLEAALPPCCSPHTPHPPSPPPEDCPLEGEPTNIGGVETGTGAEAGLENTTISSQSQNQFESVSVATQPTKDEHQSLAGPPQSEEQEEEQEAEQEKEPTEMPEPASNRAPAPEAVAGQQPMRERQDSEEEEDIDGMDEEEVREVTWDEEEPVSPVLDLDSSFDKEVMELMSSSILPPSLLHLSSPSPPPPSRRGKGRTLRSPPCSSRPLDDLSLRLRQSPFSTEASPETSPSRAPLTPPSPPLRSPPSARESPPLSKAPSITVLPLTPKIGMGKPAITKRKFSPGRARVKQAPSITVLPLTPKIGMGKPAITKRKFSPGRARVKQCVSVEPFQPKDEEENSMHNTVVMFSTSDHFTLRQDMCVVCGSFGQGAEGRLLPCSQCGQCYHPYCVNVKCGSASPGLRSDWQSNYSRCGPCSSLSRCPVCQRAYATDDLILQCQQCDRCKPKLKLRIINQNSVSVLQTPDPDPPTEQDHSRGDLECELKSDSSPERDQAPDEDVAKEPEVADDNKKRKRKPYRPGIGGFMVRQRGGKSGTSRISLSRKDSTETLGRDEGLLDGDIAMETAPPADQTMEKVKKRYRKKKTKLEEAFPSYLQEAFFGRDLLVLSRQVDRKVGPETLGSSQSAAGYLKSPTPGSHGPSPSELLGGAMATNKKQGQLRQFQVERSPSPFDDTDSSSSPPPENTDSSSSPPPPENTDSSSSPPPENTDSSSSPPPDNTDSSPPPPPDITDFSSPPPPPDNTDSSSSSPPPENTDSSSSPPPENTDSSSSPPPDNTDSSPPPPPDITDFSSPPPPPDNTDSSSSSPPPENTDSSSSPPPENTDSSSSPPPDNTDSSPPPPPDITDFSSPPPPPPDNTDSSSPPPPPDNTDSFLPRPAGLDISSMADDTYLTSELTGSGRRGQRAMQEEPLDAILSPELDKMVTDGAILSKLYKIPGKTEHLV